jgi:hypothetical protein
MLKGKGRTNSQPVNDGSEDAPAVQVSEPSATGPRLNEAGEMLIFIPPTSMEMEVLKLQGTEISKINIYFGD